MDLSEIHNCEKCRGKIVSITVDLVGVTRCGYCNQVVDYNSYFRQELKKHPEIEKLLKHRNI